jgi:dihydrodipicolinate synthase/N-acetylneuraminate lyase
MPGHRAGCDQNLRGCILIHDNLLKNEEKPMKTKTTAVSAAPIGHASCSEVLDSHRAATTASEQPRPIAREGKGNAARFSGAAVPIVTPVTATGELDEASLDRLVEHMLAGRVEGVFVLGSTGEGPSVPREWRLKLVRRTVERVAGQARVYAGIGDNSLEDSVESARAYFDAGVDAVVGQPPVYFPLLPGELLAWYRALLDRLPGPLIIYNIPPTTRVSIPLDVIGQLRGHPRLAGVKDSENDPQRLEEMMTRFGGDPDFVILIGVGALMAPGLRLGAHGTVPSVGNLIPRACHEMCAAAVQRDWDAVDRAGERMLAVAALYQKDRAMSQAFPVLKAALSLMNLTGPDPLPPLLRHPESEFGTLRHAMQQLSLLD